MPTYVSYSYLRRRSNHLGLSHGVGRWFFHGYGLAGLLYALLDPVLSLSKLGAGTLQWFFAFGHFGRVFSE